MTCRLSHRRYRLPLLHAVNTAHGAWTEREGIIVRLEDPTGRVGFGEVAPIPWFGTETLAEAQEALAKLGDAVEPAALHLVEERLGCLRFAMATALGAADDGTVGTSRMPVAALLPAGRAALMAVKQMLEEGYVACKWKVGVGDVADEWAMLDDLLAELPGHVKLRLDANGAWSARQAARWLERCAERPIEFVEQPVPPQNVDALRGLAADYPTTLALDESVTGLPSLRVWLERGWPGVVVVKPALAGVPASVLELLAKHQADVVFSSACETAVGRRAALQMAFQFNGVRPRALGFGVTPLFKDARFDGLSAVPFVSLDDVRKMEPEAVWNALS